MIRIVTDSSSYFLREEARELGVCVVPMSYTVNGNTFLESYSDANGAFETLLRSARSATTSQPGGGAFLSCFSEELQSGNEVLCITISSRLSGTFGTAYTAAREVDSDRIVVFDSRLTAGGLALLIAETAKLIAKQMTLGEVVRRLPEIRERIAIAFSVDDIAPIRTSGRLGYVRMSVNTILNIKPILLCQEGVVLSDGVARGSSELIRRLSARVDDRVSDAIVNYIGNRKTAAWLYDVIRAQHPGVRARLRKMGPVLGINLGTGVIAVSTLRRS